MIPQNDKERILVDFDCLYDVRLAALGVVDEDLAARTAVNKDYINRYTDNIIGISKLSPIKIKDYNDALVSKDVGLLFPYLKPTSIVDRIRKLILETARTAESEPVRQNFEVHINLKGYGLTSGEVAELRDVLIDILCTEDIGFVDLSSEELTPVHLKNHYRSYVLYSFDDWIKIHLDALKKKPMAAVSLYPAAISATGDEGDVTFLKYGMAQDAIRELFAAHARVIFLPASEYSICLPDKI